MSLSTKSGSTEGPKITRSTAWTVSVKRTQLAPVAHLDGAKRKLFRVSCSQPLPGGGQDQTEWHPGLVPGCRQRPLGSLLACRPPSLAGTWAKCQVNAGLNRFISKGTKGEKRFFCLFRADQRCWAVTSAASGPGLTIRTLAGPPSHPTESTSSCGFKRKERLHRSRRGGPYALLKGGRGCVDKRSHRASRNRLFQ